ncbi:MAG TPA: AraC family transcriptional regulator [Prolixibacteraceae bacterium]|nr:AraC family transcriptional regulator [Prolixibacteraceae bacterium]HPS13746.1 AraC family transcriptional regulator [Prolixibacteraceae bacterium]
MAFCKTYQFRKRKYGSELLIDLIRLESLEPYIRSTPCHILSYYDITLIHSGSGCFALDEQVFPVQKNRLYFTSPGRIREWKVNQMPRGLVLIFEEEFLCNFFNDALFVKNLSFFNSQSASPSLILSDRDEEYLTNLMIQIEQEIHQKKETHLLRALLYQALAWLDKLYRSGFHIENNPSGNKTALFSQLVENHFRNEHSVAFYAEKLCITPGYLNDLIKKETGTSAKQFIINRQITEAKRLLLYSELPISEISWQLGFNDPSYFTRLFRHETGTSSLAFRKKHP